MGKKHRKHRKIVYACIFSLFFAAVPITGAAAKTNIALGCKIDSFCCAAGENQAARLTDHDPGYETKWETGDGSSHPGTPHWIILDFGAETGFDRLRLIKASQGARDFGRTEFNADGFAFSVSSDKENWTLLLDIAGDGENDIFEASFPPVAARYLKLAITHPEQEAQSGETGPARLYDLKVFEYSEPLQTTEPEETVEIEPEPVPLSDFPVPDTSDPSLVLLLLLSAALILTRKFIIHHLSFFIHHFRNRLA